MYAPMAAGRFAEELNAHIAHEFAASQQYVAIAVYYDSETLPQLAAHFYRQAVEERNHAMMIVQYLLDADLPVTISAVCMARLRGEEMTTSSGVPANRSRASSAWRTPSSRRGTSIL